MADGALNGIKILDLMWVIAGPSATRVLADMGATVVRVESTTSPDAARTAGAFRHGETGPESAAAWGTFNASKLGVTLNLNIAEGQGVFRDLVAWADIVCESFTAGQMASWGLDYERLREINPRLIMLSSNLFGQTGPLAASAGFGNMAHSITGFTNIGGYPGSPPVGPFLAYTDCIAPRFSVAALMAALDRRERTGEGVYIDQAQAEGAMHFLATALLDYQANGRILERDGNRDPAMAPHGVYPTLEEDGWVAVVARSDEEWASLATLMEQPALAGDSRFETLAARKANEDELDAIVAAWTAKLPGAEVEARVQAVGVPAHVVQGSALAFADPQLQHRGHFVEVEHPLFESTTVEATRFTMSRTPPQVLRCAPTFGRDNDHVLREMLGYDDERITELVVAGALE